MKLVIQTQIEENYGAHDWDGKGACPQYWKCKGGNTYVVRNISKRQAERINRDGIPNLTELITESNDGFREYIISTSVVEDDVKECEEWDTPIVLSYNVSAGQWKAECKRKNDTEHGYMHRAIEEHIQRWTLGKNGLHTGHMAYYKLCNGKLVTSAQLEAELESLKVAA